MNLIQKSLLIYNSVSNFDTSFIFEEINLKSLGTQILLDLQECDPYILDDLAEIKALMLSAAKSAGATIVGETFHKFSPVGVTGVISIAESHISIHTWLEHLYASVDIFSCGENFDLEKSAQLLIEGLSSSKPRRKIVERGIDTEF